MTTAAEPQSLLLQMLDPAHRADPYPLYARIRAQGPVQLPANNLTVFSTYAACDEILRHPHASSDRLKSTLAQRAIADGAQPRPFGPPGFLFLDPPDHTRLRRLVSKAFVPKVVKALEPEIVALVDALLADAGGTFDAIEGLAYPLPVAVICRLLGVPLADEPEFSAASALLAQSLDPFATVTGSAGDGFEERMQAARWLRGYLRELISQRRRDPGEDLMSGLIQVEESGDQLTEDEIVATCNLLLVAGHETTVNLIANAILALLSNDGQWSALAADPARVGAVVEETLRYDPPVQLVGRIAAEDMTVGTTTVPKGDNMLLLTAAAHRDPDAVDRPDEFDPDRESFRHLGFGKGPHFCIGAPLARLEAAVALTALTSRFPGAQLAGEPSYKQNVTLRGMSELPITL
ncbi:MULTISPECIES: cytochrome P450 [Mycolicibacterium]|uniref:Steroid C26-monooxygenase n=1 Tax=Mycolicibacterium gilvum (strain DSM 45189 / LMG 24558 / Spyr1) TaxID=278137 RepID=E6TKM1_MYCSR|nr:MULTISPECIES: cytochrome P450 [Mycolicibacterium]ADU01487.1 cytochrome P450 [Mycolicibacterium gilvum Spyr1]MBV5242037.1 cytochrome P450 [Mycolicibacterium sp. PAM1]